MFQDYSSLLGFFIFANNQTYFAPNPALFNYSLSLHAGTMQRF